MTYRTVLKKIKDKSVSDKEIYKILDTYSSDKYDAKGNPIPITQKEIEDLVRLGEIACKFRPKVMEKLRKTFVKQHGKCCR